jgi:hypothetical protein
LATVAAFPVRSNARGRMVDRIVVIMAVVLAEFGPRPW